jgi:hypothetical protein
MTEKHSADLELMLHSAGLRADGISLPNISLNRLMQEEITDSFRTMIITMGSWFRNISSIPRAKYSEGSILSSISIISGLLQAG